MGQHIQIDASATPPYAWDDLTRGQSVFMSSAYRSALDEALPDNVQSRYLVINIDGCPAAAVAVQLLTVTDEILALRDRTSFQDAQRPTFLDHAGRWVRNRGLGILGRRVLVIGNLFSCGPHGISPVSGHKTESLWKFLPEVLRTATSTMGSFNFVVVKDFQAGDAGHSAPTGYVRFRLESSMKLAIDPTWNSYEDYLSTLNAKYRKAAIRVMESMASAGCSVEILQDIAPEADRLHALYLQVESRAQIRFGCLSCDYLPSLAEKLGAEKFRCTVIRRGGVVIGFSALLKDGDTAVAHVVGFDYVENETLPVYLRLLQVIISDAIALRCTHVDYGRTALEPKARLGALPVATAIWTRHSNRFINLFVGPLLRLVPQDRAPTRQPFRTSKSAATENSVAL